jgi:hypothetical protein
MRSAFRRGPLIRQVKQAWFKRYSPEDLPASFDAVVQSWDTANKASEHHLGPEMFGLSISGMLEYYGGLGEAAAAPSGCGFRASRSPAI